MDCNLCEKAITDYSTEFNHLVIDDAHSVDICQACIDKFIKWQGKMIAVLFPTKAMKKKYGKDKMTNESSGEL